MRKTVKALALSLGIFGTASIALAEGSSGASEGTAQVPESMMQEDGTMEGMSGMMGMMQMMQQMKPMMERCNGMMAAMTDHMKSVPHDPEAPEEKG